MQKKMGKGRGHMTEGHYSLCWRRRFSLSRSFVVLAEDPRTGRCCSKKKKKKKKKNGVVVAGAKYFLGKSVRVCVCFISSQRCTSHMTPPKIIIIGRGGCDAQEKTCGTTTSVASTTTPLLDDDQQNDDEKKNDVVVIDFREQRR